MSDDVFGGDVEQALPERLEQRLLGASERAAAQSDSGAGQRAGSPGKRRAASGVTGDAVYVVSPTKLNPA
jgi:hypothetical protein